MNDQFTLPPSYHSFVASGRYDGPDAPALKKFYIYSDVSHTHPARRGFFRKSAKRSKMSEVKSDTARYIHIGQAALLSSRRAIAR